MTQSQFAPAPRSVPLSCRLRLLFGGTINLIGWGFFCFGILFAGIFVPMADFSFVHFRGQTTLIQGVVEASEMTDTYEDEAPVFRIHYSFELADGSFHGGSSYVTGVELDPGTPITIEYPENNPWISRVEGMRSAPFGLGVLFVLVFPAVGAAVALYGLKNGWKTIVCSATASSPKDG